MFKIFVAFVVLSITIQAYGQPAAYQPKSKVIAKNGMLVSWHYQYDTIYFRMSAPTDGWVTIGFNTEKSTQGAYLLMGQMIDNTPQVVEHYTFSPGNYQAIHLLGEEAQVQDIRGSEKGEKTTLWFALPVKAASKYQKDLLQGMKYHMIIAYSQEDDFQHHSIMRTFVEVEL